MRLEWKYDCGVWGLSLWSLHVLLAFVSVLPGTLWYCWERLQQPCNLSAQDADRETDGWMFRWLPSSSFYKLQTKKKSKPRCLTISHAPRTVVSDKFEYSHFQNPTATKLQFSSLCVTTIYLLFNTLKAARGRSSCAGTGSGCNRHCVGTWVFVFWGVWHAPTPSHSWALHVWPHLKANPRGKKRKRKSSPRGDVSVSAQGWTRLHSEARKHFHGAVAALR